MRDRIVVKTNLKYFESWPFCDLITALNSHVIQTSVPSRDLKASNWVIRRSDGGLFLIIRHFVKIKLTFRYHLLKFDRFFVVYLF